MATRRPPQPTPPAPEDAVFVISVAAQLSGLHPQTLRHHYELYIELMRKRGPLSRIRREMIAVVISAENRCHY